MQNLFLIILGILTIFSQYIIYREKTLTGASNKIPVLYWVTDANPARVQQVAVFRQWLKRNGFPDMEIRIDSANTGLQKTIIQTVTGTAGDFIDIGSGNIQYLQEMDVLRDMTSVDTDFGYRSEDTYEGTRGDIYIDGKRYGFPCNIAIAAPLVNIDLFEKLGAPRPPPRWDFDTFERMGIEFVRKANAGKKRQEVFFIDNFEQEMLRRTAGVSTFNETLTSSALNQPKYVHVLRTLRRWVVEIHLIPTAGEKASFALEQGYGAGSFQLFNRGYFGMIYAGRWALIQLRAMKANFRMDAVEPPNAGFPCSAAFSRSVVVYRGTQYPDLVPFFCAFLRSADYNLLLARDSDGNTPETPYLKSKDFLEPEGRTNEWPMHQSLARIGNTIAQGREFSPFVLQENYLRAERKIIEGFLIGVTSAEDTARLIHDNINEEIRKHLDRHPEKRERYQTAIDRQTRIDSLKKAGKKIPLELVDNAYLKKYYRATGLGE